MPIYSQEELDALDAEEEEYEEECGGENNKNE